MMYERPPRIISGGFCTAVRLVGAHFARNYTVLLLISLLLHTLINATCPGTRLYR